MKANFRKFSELIEKSLNELFGNKIAEMDLKYVEVAEDAMEEYVPLIVESITKDMNKYMHQKDTSICGNFCDLRFNYARECELNRKYNYDELLEKLDTEVIADDFKEDYDIFMNWLAGWFFEAFGTYNLCYNFSNFIESYMENIEGGEE